MYIVVMQSQTQRKAEQAISSAIWRGGRIVIGLLCINRLMLAEGFGSPTNPSWQS